MSEQIGTALVVEDVNDIAELAGHMLKLNGYEPTLVGSVREAQALLANADYDVVFLDQNLPDGMGTSLIDGLYKSENPKNPRIFITTSQPTHPEVVAALKDEGKDIKLLTKPWNYDLMRDSLVGVVGSNIKLSGQNTHLNPVRDSVYSSKKQ